MQSSQVASDIRPISHQSTNDKVFELVAPRLADGARVVDVGAGEGYFAKMMGDHLQRGRDRPSDRLSACDLFPEFFKYEGIACDPIRADGSLPYDDASFDVACSLEVVEHLEDQFAFTRELFRIVRPGGFAVVSTPNVLNINSRLRYLHSGFAVLFDPLLISSQDPRHTSGHINPVAYYYLAYMLRRAGFDSVEVHFDRHKASAKGLLVLCGWFVALGNALFRSRLRRRKGDVERENQGILDAIGSREMLTARSVIAVARKRG